MPDEPDRPRAGTGGRHLRSAAEGLATDDRIANRYRLESVMATGGMSTVWRAVDEVLTRPVAVKVLLPRLADDPEFVARFRREAVAAARLAHPLIVATYDTCDDPEAIVMELVDGRTLRDELDRRRLLPVPEAVGIASSVAQALEVAHKAGLVHRDIKPANILLTSDGHVKVADFGIAKALTPDDDPSSDPDLPDLTEVGRMVGTAKYLAPEQVRGGAVDARTDVYALGAVLYEMLCGRPPFSGDNDLATATARLHAVPERPRQVLRTIPAAVDAVVVRALATDPDDRYPSATDLWSALQSVPHSEDEAAARPEVIDATVLADAPSFTRAERSWLMPAALITVIAVALGLAWVLIGGSAPGRQLFGIDLGGDDGPDPEPVAIVGSTDFDPFGGDGENGQAAGRAHDGDPSSAWVTERYTSRDLGGRKPGVGIVFDLGEEHDVAALVLQSPDAGWSAEIHVGSGGETYEDWGSAAARVEDAAAGDTIVDLDGARGSRILVWITDLGPGDGAGGISFHLAEAAVTAT